MTNTSLSSVFCPLSSPLASLASRLATLRRGAPGTSRPTGVRRGRSPRPTDVRAARWSAPTVASLASRLATLRRGRSPRPTGVRAARWSAPTVASLASCLATLLTTASLFADVPVSINVAGGLEGVTRTGVAAPADAKAMFMAFRLYATPGSGRAIDKKSALWGRQASVSLENGSFDVDLTDGLGSKVDGAEYDTLAEAVNAVLARGSSVFYLGITPENDANAEIFPRQRITAVFKAVQADIVRNVPDSFSVTGGLFKADEVSVQGSTTLAGKANYSLVSFAPGKSISFEKGLIVKGTVRSGSVVAVSASAAVVETDVLNVSASPSLRVAQEVQVAGAPVWNGKLGADTASGPTTAVSVVRGSIEADLVGEANELDLSDFVNNAGQGFDSSSGSSWSILGDWMTISDTSSYEEVERAQILCWNESTGQYDSRTSVTGGRWQAPCDCLAYFQVHVESASSSYGSCVQFYVLDDPDDSTYTSRTPNALVSFRNGGSSHPHLNTAAPLILTKGQWVKWLGYNPDQNDSSDIPELKHSHVERIVYRKFNWR